MTSRSLSYLTSSSSSWSPANLPRSCRLAGPYGRRAGRLGGLQSCLTISCLGLQCTISLTGEWGCKPASPMTWADTAECAKLSETTTKSYTLPLHVGPRGATMTPPTSFSHPVPASCSGVQFQSPPMHQGPTSAQGVCHGLQLVEGDPRKNAHSTGEVS